MKQLLIFAMCLVNSAAFAQIKDSAVCDRIEMQYNEFKKETTLFTPALNCSLMKVITGKRAEYYLSLHAEGASVVIDGKGAKIKLSNGQILSFPGEAIDVKLSDG